MADTTKSPRELWIEAGGDTPRYDRDRYRQLMIDHGLLIPLKPGETAEPLPCGWPRRRVADQHPDAEAGAELTGMPEEQADWDGDGEATDARG